MHPSFRIVLPASAALLSAAGILTVLFLRLDATRAMLSTERNPALVTATGATERAIMSPMLLSIREDGALLHLRQGDLFAMRGEWKNATDAYQQAVKSDGGMPALRKLIDAQLQRRDMRGARDTLDRLKRAGASTEDLLLWEASVALRTGELTHARALLDRADASPQRSYGLALLAIIGDHHEEARGALTETAGGWEPILRARARQLLGAYEEYARFPDSPTTHLHTLLSRALAGAGECELALPMLSRVTRTQADYRDAWIVRGFCELMTERSAEAVASLEHAYRIDPQKAETQYFLARTYLAIGDRTQALTFLQYALRNGFEPASEVRTILAETALQAQLGTLAYEQYVILMEQPHATPETFAGAMQAALLLRDTAEAQRIVQAAEARWPGDPRVQALAQASGMTALEAQE